MLQKEFINLKVGDKVQSSSSRIFEIIFPVTTDTIWGGETLEGGRFEIFCLFSEFSKDVSKYKKIEDGSNLPAFIPNHHWNKPGILENKFLFNYYNKLTDKRMENFTTTLKKITRKEPEKTFVKAGFMNEQEDLTQDGVDALYHILWQENEEKLKILAKQIIKENEK